MGKAPAFQMYVRDWTADTRSLDGGPKGAWIDILMHLHLAKKRGRDTHTLHEWSLIIGQPEDATAEALRQFGAQHIAHVRNRKGQISIMSRRMHRERKAKERNALYQQRHRDKDDRKEKVRPPSSSASSSASAKKKETPPKPRPRGIEQQEETSEMPENANKPEWLRAIMALPQLNSADELHSAAEAALAASGFSCTREFEVGDRGDGRPGRLDLLAERTGLTLAIEIDRKTPRQKSIHKLRQPGVPENAYRVILLREGKTGPPPAGIDLVIGLGRDEKPPQKTTETAEPPGFQKWWAAYPTSKKRRLKVNPKKCLALWKEKGCEQILAVVLAALEAEKRSDQWRKEGGQFIPMTTTWLAQERWKGVEQPQEKGKPRKRVTDLMTRFGELPDDDREARFQKARRKLLARGMKDIPKSVIATEAAEDWKKEEETT